jgi:small subunit ribosomal protein S18
MPKRPPKKRMNNKRKGQEDEVKKRSRFLEGVTDIDITDHEFLRKFVTEHGKIIPARMTGASAKQQRQIKHGIRRARTMGLLQ